MAGFFCIHRYLAERPILVDSGIVFSAFVGLLGFSMVLYDTVFRQGYDSVVDVSVASSDTVPFSGACVLLVEVFEKNAFLSIEQRVSFCENACDFMIVNCAGYAQQSSV